MSNKVIAPQRNARANILETAWRLVGERGVQAVTVADIAAASGVSRQLVYHHFESRAGLLVAMTRHHDAASGFRKRLVATRDLEPVEGFEAGLRLWLGYVPEVLHVARALEAALIAGDEGGAAWRDRMGELHAIFRAAVRRIELSPGWTTETASDWIWARLQPSAYAHLVEERAWTHDQFTEWSVESLMSELTEP